MEIQTKNLPKAQVHHVLIHSYFVYFILFLVGVVLDVFFKLEVFISPLMVPVGIALLIFASFLILWAQITSRNLPKDHIDKEMFCHGPYCYTRSPTHWGLFLLMLGFGIVSNAVFVILFTLFAFIISKFGFLEKEEKILADKYGAPYLEYKKIVRF